MNKSRFLAGVLFCAGILSFGGLLCGQKPSNEIPGRYIVMLKAGADAGSVIAGHGLVPDMIYSRAVNGFAGVVPANRLRALARDPRVHSVEPDRVVSLVPPKGAPVLNTRVQASAVETLPTGVDRIDADVNPRHDVSSVGVAIIDTGIWLTHADLNVAGNVTFVSGTRSGDDDDGHGTHVAGIVGAKMNNIGVRGVAPNARLYAVKVLNKNGSGYLSWVIKGVDWVTAKSSSLGIKVANMSLGFSGTSPALDAAISNSVAAGVTYVVAAGNESADAAGFSPANHPDVIAVSAMADSDGKCGALGPRTSYGRDDTFASFSNFGARVAICAPGVNILSTWMGNKKSPSGLYATASGTSMASPHVAGAAAQYIAGKPGSSPAAVRAALILAATPQSPVTPTPDPTGRLRGGFSGDPDSIPEPLVDAAGL